MARLGLPVDGIAVQTLRWPTREAGGTPRPSRSSEKTLADRERLLGTDHPHTKAVRDEQIGRPSPWPWERSANRADQAAWLRSVIYNQCASRDP